MKDAVMHLYAKENDKGRGGGENRSRHCKKMSSGVQLEELVLKSHITG